METKQRLPVKSSDFTWIAEQWPQLSQMPWWQASSEVGAFVVNDMLDKVFVSLWPVSATDRNWEVGVHIDAYTESHEDESVPVPLDQLLGEVDIHLCDGDTLLNLVALLRKHADRIEAGVAAEKRQLESATA